MHPRLHLLKGFLFLALMLNTPLIHVIQEQEQVYIVLVNYRVALVVIIHVIFPRFNALAP